MSFFEDIKTLMQNKDIVDYFTEKNISIVSFVQKYIQIDKILRMQFEDDLDVVSLSQQINQLNNIIEQQQTSQVTELKVLLSEQFVNLQNQLHNANNSNNLKDVLQSFQEKLVNINVEQLNDLDRKHLHTLSNFQSNLLKDLNTTLDSHTIHHKITSINDTLTMLHNNFTGNSSQKGKMTENLLYHNLLKAFPDCDVVLTRDQSDSCDIQIKHDEHPTILIDSKHCEASNVRKSDLVKFYEDCELNNSCGILCNAFGGIANRKHFEIDIKDKRVLVFLSNHQFDPVMFQLAARIIYNVHSIIKEQKTDMIQIDNQLYQKLKLEYNFFLQTFQQHLDNIKQNVNALSELTFTQLDHFFKRTALHNDQSKPFSCHLCGTGTATTKALKRHLKDKHNFVMQPSKRGRPVTDITSSSKNNSEE